MVYTAPIRGDFPSLKLGRMVRYHSTIERDLLYFLEYWQDVGWYQEQPLTIEQIMSDGRCRRYTPDYEIHRGSLKILAECKPEERLDSDQAKKQRKIGEKWAEDNGYSFVTFTDTELRSGQQLSNLKLLWRYARLRSIYPQKQILLHIQDKRVGTVTSLCQELELSSQVVMPVVCHLLFHHHIEMDMQYGFTHQTSFKIVESKGE